MLPNTLPHTLYTQLANKTLSNIYDYLDNQNIDSTLDYTNSVITYKVSGIGDYVFNKQPPLQQLWVSSPLSGPSHFECKDKQFIENKSKEEITGFIKKEIESIINKRNKR
ncbi:frataxin [Hamiltosporidium magnivora]|uniref:Frataxin n=1 Tax=Hamiltosporidium magnivora TaxID=148818 RepID=A0A4Q9LEH3_9MICR|nr:frataxin [Hamiltosporidium magnivora]